MKMSQLTYILIVFAALLGSCRSQFEKVRVSGDPKLKLETAHTYFAEEDYHKAQLLYEQVIPDYRGRPETEDIFFNYAYTHYHQNQFLLAAHYFTQFANTFTTSEKREEADYMSAYSHYQMSPKYKLEQSETKFAIDELQTFANTYPNSERVAESNALIDELREKLEVKAIENATLYYNLRQYQAALHTLQNVLNDFPDSDQAEQLRYLMVKSSELLAKNSVFTKKEERYGSAQEFAELFIRKYPKSEYINDVQRIEGDIKEELNKLRS